MTQARVLGVLGLQLRSTQEWVEQLAAVEVLTIRRPPPIPEMSPVGTITVSVWIRGCSAIPGDQLWRQKDGETVTLAVTRQALGLSGKLPLRRTRRRMLTCRIPGVMRRATRG